MATTGSTYDDAVVSVGKTFFPDPLAFSLSSVVSAAPLRSTHGLPVPTERTLLPNPQAFRQPSDEWIPAAPRRLPTARFSSPPPEQPAVSYGNTHNDDRRYHGRLSVMELCNDEASEQRTVHRTTTQRPVAAPVIYSRPLHRGKHHSFHSGAAVVPVYGGTPSRPGGVRERRDASAPRGNATVRSVAGAGGHSEDGVSIGASPFLQPPAWVMAARRGAVQPPAATPPPAASASAYPPVARAREGRRLDGVSHVDRRVSSSGADRPAGHAVGRSVSLSPPNPLAPEEVRYYANIAASDFDILPGAVTLTKHYTEDTVFEYPNKTVSSSFQYLDHPLVAHIVPYIRRPSRRRTVSPEYLAAIVRRALPIFETHFKNYTRVTKSPLLDQFISALYGLVKLLPVDLAVKLNQLILPDRHATNIQLPVNFELPTFPSLPRNTPLETYEYSDDERLAMSHFNDPAFKYIFPFWRRPEIIKETDPDHIPALLAQFRLGISAFLHWIIGVRGAALSTTFVPIVAAAIRNTVLAAKMFPQDAETQSWLDELPKFPEDQELEFPALAFPPNESVGFPPKWQPSPSDPLPSESTSSMFRPRSRGSSSGLFHHEALQAPHPSSVHTVGEDPNRGVMIKPNSLSESYVKDAPNNASPPPVLDENDDVPESIGAPIRCASQDATSGQNEPDNDVMSVDPPFLDENDDVPEATGAPNRCASQDATSGQNEPDNDIMSVDPPVLDENDHIPEATGAPNRCASQDATSGQNESDDDIMAVDSPVPDKNDDVPEAVVAPDAIEKSAERTLHSYDPLNVAPVVRLGMPDSREATSAQNEPNNGMMSVDSDENHDVVLGGTADPTTEKGEGLTHVPSNDALLMVQDGIEVHNNSTSEEAISPSAMRDAVHKPFPPSAVQEQDEALALTASRICQFLTDLRQRPTEIIEGERSIGHISIWPHPIGFMNGTERRHWAKRFSSLAKYSYFAECFREKAPGRMWIGMFVTAVGTKFWQPGEWHVWAAIIISPEAPAQGKKLLIYDSEGPDVDFQQCRARDALRTPLQLDIWRQQKTPFAELWRSNYNSETLDQKQCMKNTREFLIRTVKCPPSVKAGPDGETLIDGFQRVPCI